MKKLLSAAALTLLAASLATASLCAEPATEEEPQPKPESKPDITVFTLADGSQVAGQVAFKEVTIVTAYGKLVVPLSDVIRLRVGRGSDKKAAARIAELIELLGSADFEKRQKATEALTDLGHEALEQLREATKHDDAEIKTRAEKLVGEIEDMPLPGDDDDEDGEGPLMGSEDELVTSKFTAMGKVEIEDFAVTTQYGNLTVPRDQVVKAIFSQPDGLRKNIKFTGDKGTRTPMLTRIKLKRGDKVKITANGTIRYNNYNRDIPPVGDRSYFGNSNNCPGMSLVYRIGDNTTWQSLGKGKTFKVESKGELILAINHNNSNMQHTGAWKIKVRVTPKQ